MPKKLDKIALFIAKPVVAFYTDEQWAHFYVKVIGFGLNYGFDG